MTTPIDPVATSPAPIAQAGDSLAALRAKLERAKSITIEIPPADVERAKLLAELSDQAARIAKEKREKDEFTMNAARYEVRERVGESVPLESTVIDGVGAFVVRAPNREQRKKLNDAAGKSGFEAASMTFAMQVTEYPPKEELKETFERFPYVIDTLVTMGMRAGGAQIDTANRKS